MARTPFHVRQRRRLQLVPDGPPSLPSAELELRGYDTNLVALNGERVTLGMLVMAAELDEMIDAMEARSHAIDERMRSECGWTDADFAELARDVQ